MRFLFFVMFSLFIFSVFSLGMETDDDVLYKSALAYRDEKKTEQAKKAFETLSKKGHKKAMHNLALILTNENKYLAAFNWFKKASLGADGLIQSKNNAKKLLDKHGLHVIVKSTCPSRGSNGPLVDLIFDQKNANFSFKKNFLEDTLILCSSPTCNRENNHALGTPTRFDFNNKIIISAFIERPSTISDHPRVLFEEIILNLGYDQLNCVTPMIKKISEQMPSGANIEIEWLPYTGLYNCLSMDLEKAVQCNPFHSFFDSKILFAAIFSMAQESGPDDTANINEMKKRIALLLNFYANKGVGTFTTLLNTIYWEAQVISKMLLGRHPYVLIDYEPRKQDWISLRAAIPEALFFEAINANISQQRVAKFYEYSEEKKGFIYNPIEFIGSTFLNAMIQDLAAEYNSPYLKKHLENFGYKNISIKRQDNPYNDRKNVWMISLENP